MPTPNDPAPAEPGPLFWMGARALTHVGEFRRYYALFAVWVLVMIAVPRADGPLTDTFATAPAGAGVGVASTTRAPESAAAAALTRPSSPGASTFFADPLLEAVTGPSTFGSFEGSNTSGDPSPSPGPTFAFEPPAGSGGDDEPAPDEDESAAPALTIPPPPATPIPPPPAELEPLLRVVAPLANTGCSPIGLAGVVVALVGPSVDQVPAGQIVPYLTPLYVACGSFPQTGPRTVCEIDDAYVSQDPSGGLLPPPAIVGLGIDTIAQLEAALGGLTNQAETLRQQLHCRVGGG